MSDVIYLVFFWFEKCRVVVIYCIRKGLVVGRFEEGSILVWIVCSLRNCVMRMGKKLCGILMEIRVV